MAHNFFVRLLLLLLLGSFIGSPTVFAASIPAELQKAKKEAEASGYAFIANRAEILAKAKKEGALRVLAEMQPPNIKASTAAFMNKYPFIKLHIEQITGTDSAQRNILEIKSGTAKEWDIIHLSTDFYSEYLPYLWKVDLLGMAKQGVLQIPAPMIDPKNRNVVSFFTRFQVTAYNPKLFHAHLLPKTWEDLLKPELRGRKFAADIRPTEIAGLVPAWGLERTLEFARKLAAQQPIWVRGGSRTLTSIIAGEVPMMIGPNFGSVKRAQRKDPAGNLRYVIVEPVPVRLTLQEAIQVSAPNRNAALLWLEWMASPEAQKLTDEHEPFDSSVYVRGGAVESELRGKKISELSWEHHQNMDQWQAKVFEAYGFPKLDKTK
ncbi:MAG: ABC transporter substrate-binding protein [Candidatus Binatia bacterium]